MSFAPLDLDLGKHSQSDVHLQVGWYNGLEPLRIYLFVLEYMASELQVAALFVPTKTPYV